MTTELKAVGEVFYQTVANTLDELAFMEVIDGRERGGCPDDPGPVFFTRLPIYSPVRAAIGLIVPAQMAAEMTENILGQPADIIEDEFKIIDAQCEVANTVAGNLMSRLVPEGESFELGLPECRYIADNGGQKDWAGAEEFALVWNDGIFWGVWEG